MPDFIHNDPEFKELLTIVSAQRGIDMALIEKDYWIMHALYSLQQQGIEFELKGGTSLSKGFGLIHRFSEDIDLHVKSNLGHTIEGKEDNKEVKNGRKQFYDALAAYILIDGIIKIKRDAQFDDISKYRSGGIRLYYKTYSPALQGVKDGILLEVGFDTVTPNIPVNIGSWVWDYLIQKNLHTNYINNNAIGVLCYHPGYTLVEKLQAIIRKYRVRMKTGEDGNNFMRQYYDVYCLLGNNDIIEFIKSTEYELHKKQRIKGADNTIPINEQQAFLLDDSKVRELFKKQYESTAKLYYQGQPPFNEVMQRIRDHLKYL